MNNNIRCTNKTYCNEKVKEKRPDNKLDPKLEDKIILGLFGKNQSPNEITDFMRTIHKINTYSKKIIRNYINTQIKFEVLIKGSMKLQAVKFHWLILMKHLKEERSRYSLLWIPLRATFFVLNGLKIVRKIQL